MGSIVFGFCLLIITKAFVEPLATSIGRKLIAHYVEDACEILDTTLEMVGFDFDPEAVVRDYLNVEASQLTEAQVRNVVETVFREWDLRNVACSGKNSIELE